MTKSMKEWLQDAPGRAFDVVRVELGQAGFVQVKTIRNRATKNSIAVFRKADRGDDPAYTIEVEHDWDYDHYGIGRAGKVVRTSELQGGMRNDYT